MQPTASSEWTAKIAVWDVTKGYGFLQFGDKRVFLHRRDLVGMHLTPKVGDEIRFTLGHDGQGRVCARNAVNARGGLGISLLSLTLLAGMLVLPVMACLNLRRSVGLEWDPRWAGTYALVASMLTYGTYASDKRRAKTGEWRVSEGRLHLLELLGGWPGAWLAQRRLRHKCSKRSYQAVFGLIVLAWQFAALDSLQGWKYSRAAQKQIMAMSARRT